MKFLITESKLKEFIKKKFGVDLTGRIKMIQSYYDLPESFQNRFSKEIINSYLNKFGPMYVIVGDTDSYLYQNQNDGEIIVNRSIIVNRDNKIINNSELMKDLGIEYTMGLSIDDLINLYVNED